MKKILALLCGLTFASGAWADEGDAGGDTPVVYTYTFQLAIDKVPVSMGSMSSDATWMLIDKSQAKPTVLCYMKVGELTKHMYSDTSVAGHEVISYNGGRIDHDAGEIYTGADYGTVATVEHSLMYNTQKIENITPSAKYGEEYRNVVFEFRVATTDQTVYNMTEGSASEIGYLKDSLVGVIYDPGGNGSTGEVLPSYQVFDDIHYTKTSGATTIQGSHIFAVPEPTSGLLLLLGVAGLALRRKRAA